MLVQAQQKEIVSVQFSTVRSEYAISNSNKYRLYTPSRSQVVKNIKVGDLSRGDYVGLDLQVRGISPITLKEGAVELSGPYIILLEPYQIPNNSKRINANVLFDQVDNTPAFVKIQTQDEYKKISNNAISSKGTDYAGFHLFKDISVLPYRYSTLPGMTERSYSTKYSSVYFSGINLLSLWEDFLRNEGFEIYGKPFFVRVQNGDVYPAIIKVFGKEERVYAMYGVWTDETRANEYGYKKGDRIYFAQKEMLPADDAECTAAKELGIEQSLRYGRKTFSYSEVMSDPQNIFPQLAWAPEPIHSDMEGKTYDQIQTAFHNGIEVPTAPDNDNNLNGMGLQQCPDQDWYFELFCECAGKIVTPKSTEFNPDRFADYRDYAHMQMMGKTYDPTIYGEDESVTNQKANTEVQPVEPLLFNKDGVLLNGKIPEVFDPFATDATFSLYKRVWDWELGDLGYHAKMKDVAREVKKCLGDLKDVYDYFSRSGAHATDWSYVKENDSWKKRWHGNGDVEITLDKPQYADSSWIIANPYANYGEFEDFNTFAIYDNNTAANCGPLRLIARESDTRVSTKSDVPEYCRYSNPWIGGDIPAENAWEKKDWYIQWQYYLVYMDKYGKKTCIGKLTFTTALWKNEDDDVMPTNYELHNGRYNRSVTVGGTNKLSTQTAYYDKNSKEYRTDQTDISDRAPDEFDKGEAMQEIARKILVAEAFDYSMKTLHYISTRQKNQVGVSAGILYETSKRVENRIAQSYAYKLAKNTYEGLLLWRRTMDVLKDLRDTYLRIGEAWDGLLYAVQGVGDYYKSLDLRDIRLTNITDLFPRSAFVELDYRVFSMQKSFADFNEAVHAMALETDSLTGGNYGPLNPAIRTAYAALQSSALQTGQNTTVLLDNANSELQKLKSVTKGTSSDQQYLSNITRSTSNIIGNQRLKVMNNGTRNIALALYLTQSDAKQWLSYSRYMKHVADDVPERFETAAKSMNSDSWAALAWSLQQPRVFDPPTSNYLMQLTEEEEGNAK